MPFTHHGSRIARGPKMGKKVIVVGIIVLLLAAGAFMVHRSLSVGRAMCPACNRPVMADMKFTVVMADGEKHDFCCVRCGQHYIRLHPAKIKAALATARDTGQQMSMYDATFVFGSDVMPCCAPRTVVGDEKIAYQRAWDRCCPSLIAFSTRAAAEPFARQHGGTVLSYAETLPTAK